MASVVSKRLEPEVQLEFGFVQTPASESEASRVTRLECKHVKRPRPKHAPEASLFPAEELAKNDLQRLENALREAVVKHLGVKERFLDATFAPVDQGLKLILNRLLESAGRKAPSGPAIATVVPRDRWPCLGKPLSLYVLRSDLRGNVRTALLSFASDLRQSGRGLLGDVVEMTEDEVVSYFSERALAADAGRYLWELRRILDHKQLYLGMSTGGWTRPRDVTLAERIQKRSQLPFLSSATNARVLGNRDHLRLVSKSV